VKIAKSSVSFPTGYEFKRGNGRIRKATRTEFLNAYPGAELTTINQDNFETFVLDEG
jgi:hypothetical protein